MKKSILTEQDNKIVAYYTSLTKAGREKYLDAFDIVVLEFNDDGTMVVEYSDKIKELVQGVADKKGLTHEEAFVECLRDGIRFFEDKKYGKVSKGGKKTRTSKKTKS